MEIKTILVDDEILAMRLFELECARFEDIRIIAKFESPVKAIAYAEEHDVDMAILDIEMPEMNGIELGKELRKRRKDIILIFITAHTQYAMDAYQIHAPVYLEKPYSYEDLAYALETARLSFDPQALTSLTIAEQHLKHLEKALYKEHDPGIGMLSGLFLDQ